MDTSEKKLFPKVNKAIQNLIEDEEGGIIASKVLLIGTMIIVLGSIFGVDVLGKHSSHKSHSSHSSHSSTSYHRSHSSHTSHTSHQNTHSSHTSSTHSNRAHSNHSSHGSHTSHSNTTSHSNSNYSSSGDYNTPAAPAASSIKGPNTPSSTEYNLQLNNSSISIVGSGSGSTSMEEISLPQMQIPQDTPSIAVSSYALSELPETSKALIDEASKNHS